MSKVQVIKAGQTDAFDCDDFECITQCSEKKCHWYFQTVQGKITNDSINTLNGEKYDSSFFCDILNSHHDAALEALSNCDFPESLSEEEIWKRNR